MNRTLGMKVGCALLALCAGLAQAGEMNGGFDAELSGIQQRWAEINYGPEASREKGFEALATVAQKFSDSHAGRAEPLIWLAIVESSQAGAAGGLGALSLAKRSRKHLEQAIGINPRALEGSAYTSLGTLYYKVPGFPLGFGDDDKARQMLQKALELNPAGIDPNYFYAEFLFEDGEYREALTHLDRAASAAPRPGREAADRGRQAEIAVLRGKVNARL